MKGHLTVIHASPAAGSVGVRAQHMVIDQKVLGAQRFDALCIGADRASVIADFIVW